MIRITAAIRTGAFASAGAFAGTVSFGAPRAAAC